MSHPFPLPLFDGRVPAGTEMRVSGTSGSPTRAITLGERVAVLISGHVRDVQHPETTDSDGWTTMTRKHVVKAETVYLLEKEEGDGLLALERDRALELREAETAVQAQLPGVEQADDQGIRNLESYALRLERNAENIDELAAKMRARAADVRDRAEQMRDKLAELDLDEAPDGVDPETGEITGDDDE